jgi:hypothetical protein
LPGISTGGGNNDQLEELLEPVAPAVKCAAAELAAGHGEFHGMLNLSLGEHAKSAQLLEPRRRKENGHG